MKIKVDTRIEPTTLSLVLAEAKKQNRSKSQMLRIMIEDWFNNRVPMPKYPNGGVVVKGKAIVGEIGVELITEDEKA